MISRPSHRSRAQSHGACVGAGLQSQLTCVGNAPRLRVRHISISRRYNYLLPASLGVRTARDIFRWHPIEHTFGRHGSPSVVPMMRTAAATSVEVTWNLCHVSLPDGVDLWSPAPPERFAAFANAAAHVVRDEGDDVPLWRPCNEINCWAFAGDHQGHFVPAARGRERVGSASSCA